MLRPLLSPLVLVAVACSVKTPYAQSGFRGGYNDFEAQPGVHFVSFQGNGFTSRDEVIAGWHQRASEICGGSSRYEIISQSAATSSHTATLGSSRVDATATTYGNTTYVQGTVTEPTQIHYDKSRAEGYVRCTGGAPDEAPQEGSGGQWCFLGNVQGIDAGGCRASLDECAAYAAKLIDAGLQESSPCARTPIVTCTGATRSTDGQRVVECFPSVPACGYYRDVISKAAGWSDVSECMEPAAPRLPADPSVACDNGDATACLTVARQHYDAGDHRRSLVFTSKACKAGDAAACVYAASALEKGEGIEANPKKAAVLYKAACKLGDDAACESFARLRSAANEPLPDSTDAETSGPSSEGGTSPSK